MTVDRAARDTRAEGALRASPFLRGLSEPALRLLGRAASHASPAAGAELEVNQGGAPCLYLLLAGEVSASSPPDAEGVAR
jgi:hypothetical protein